MKYRSKPVEVEAVQVSDDQSIGELMKHLTNAQLAKIEYVRKDFYSISDWIIKDGDNFSVCSDEEFRRKYEAIEK